MTDCNATKLEFQGQGSRRFEADFRGGQVTSDAGLLLLHQVATTFDIFGRFAACFTDYRDPDRTDHSVRELVAQRVLGLCCGYEDQNDHDSLRDETLLAAVVGKQDPTGKDRKRERDKGHPLASKATLNRLERTPPASSQSARYKKVVYHEEAIRDFFIDLYMDTVDEVPEEIILDADATDDPVYGHQEGRFFHGYYGHYCYLPLYVFAGDDLLWAQLRPANIDGAEGSVGAIARIVAQIRRRWPEVRFIVRGDSGFARDDLMHWCEQNRVDYVLGLARNDRLRAKIAALMSRAKARHEQRGEAVRFFKDFRYRTRESWSCERRVVGKAEYLPGKENPRYVVTSLSEDEYPARQLYEDLYCARGDMENRIKEQQLGLFADRTSAATVRANQLRLWFSSVAYVLMNLLRRRGLKGTQMERAQVGTIRTRLLKIGAVVKVSVRRLYVAISEAFPLKELLARVLENLRPAGAT
jgi:hypothetical protein